MSMTVNNLQARHTLELLNRNSSAAQRDMQRAASGMKINTAADDASAYAISERMRVMIRSLDQAHQNVQNGSTLLKIGDGGISNIIEELRALKELALNAANDSATDEDRATLQKVFRQKMDNINDIAATTSYNGKTLLDGTHAKKYLTVTPASSTDTTPTDTTEETEETLEPEPLSAGDYTITKDGVYILADGYSGTVTINAQNVKITQATPSTALNNVSIVEPAGGNANLRIEGLNIKNNSNYAQNIIKFQGAGNYLTVKGTNIFDNLATRPASINIGGGLTIIGDGSLTAKNISAKATIIGSDYEQTSTGNITIAGDVVIDVRCSEGAAIGSGRAGSVGDIIIGGNAKVTAQSDDGAAIGSGYRGGSAGNISIGNNAIVIAKGNNSAGIGSGYFESVADNISIGGNATVTAKSRNGAAIGSGYWKSKVKNITISNSATVTATNINGFNDIGAGITGSTAGTVSNGLTTFDITLNVNEQTEPGTSSPADDSDPNDSPADDSTVDDSSTDNSIKMLDGHLAVTIQSGASANQAMNIFIEDMHTKSLGAGKIFSGNDLIHESDLSRYNALSTDTDKQTAWLATLKAAENKTLDDISVTTRENANVAIRVLDGAIEYALEQAANVGAYLSRLEHTAINVTTSSENVQSAESTIRDADMAKTMTSYTKNNVLIRAAQAMFAQANQNSNAVLGLLR